jgi:hypothetical protein
MKTRATMKPRRFVFGSIVAPRYIEVLGEFIEFVPQKRGMKLYKQKTKSKVEMRQNPGMADGPAII